MLCFADFNKWEKNWFLDMDTCYKIIDGIKGNKVKIYDNERIDDLERNGYRIIQNPEEFCFGMDAVLLSGFAKVGDMETCIDLGSGTGIIPILLCAKTKGKKFYALEIQEKSAKRAARSALLNGLMDEEEYRDVVSNGLYSDMDKIDKGKIYNNSRLGIINGDIKNASDIFGKAVCDVVTTNPPYMNENHGLKNPDEPKAIARHELLCSLEDVIREGTYLLKPGGRFYMVHRPHRLAEIIEYMKSYKLQPKRIKFVHPYIDKDANMVLIEAVRGGKPFLKLESPLIVYNKDGSYTPEIYTIYGY